MPQSLPTKDTQPDNQPQDCQFSRVYVRWIAANVARITHTSLDGDGIPPDRPWVSGVFPGLAESNLASEPDLQVQVIDGCVQINRRNEPPFFAEVQPVRLGIKRRKPYLRLEITKIELRTGLQHILDGINLTLRTAPGESFYGFGEWFNAFQRRNSRLKMHTRDAIALLQGSETYSAIPFFYSSRGYGFFLLNSYPSQWRIDPQSQTLTISADGPGADYLVIDGPDFRKILETYTRLSGRPPLLPRWAFGLFATGYPQEAQKVLLERVAAHRQRELPLDGVILDYHWEAGFHNFHWRRSLFPDPDRMISNLKSWGIRLGLIQTPFVNQRNRPFQKFLLNRLAHNTPPGEERADERTLPEYKAAQEGEYLAHPDAKWWFGAGGMVDFSNPRASAWWSSMMDPLYRQGVDFFKNDDGEYLPEDARSALGMAGDEYHNLYGFFYGKALYEGMEKVDERRAMIYARSVWAGSQRYPALFLGDQKPTFASMRRALRAGLNMSLLGFAYWTADVFGLDGKTTPETHMRYAQWALLAPVARYFWRPPEVDGSRFPWSHGPQAEANFRFYTNLRYRLLPYYYTLAWQSSENGIPVVRPLALEFPGEEALTGCDDQFMLGEALLVCPVLDQDARTRRILLPQGEWHDFWGDQATAWQGPQTIEYSAPLDRLPILARGGSILPMGPVIQNIPDDHCFDRLQLHCWPPYPASGQVYEDDGLTRAYQAGASSVTRFSVEQKGDALVLHISAAEGNYSPRFSGRQVELIFHGANRPGQVRVNNLPVGTWRYAAERHELSLPVVCPPDRPTIIQVS